MRCEFDKLFIVFYRARFIIDFFVIVQSTHLEKKKGENMQGYRLPKELRKELAKPMDLLFDGPPELSIPKAIRYINGYEKRYPTLESKRYIVCVGDVVSESFFSDSFLSKRISYYFIDGKTLRTQIKGSMNNTKINTISIRNPQGIISIEAIQKIANLEFTDPKDPTLVFVEGEEDLLALPLVLSLPLERLIFYGQPPVTDAQPPTPAGLGLLVVTPKLKFTIQNLIDRFEKIE